MLYFVGYMASIWWHIESFFGLFQQLWGVLNAPISSPQVQTFFESISHNFELRWSLPFETKNLSVSLDETIDFIPVGEILAFFRYVNRFLMPKPASTNMPPLLSDIYNYFEKTYELSTFLG